MSESGSAALETEKEDNMTSRNLWMLTLATVGGLWYLSSVEGRQKPTANGLPGARQVIDAADYSSLQSALDALPEQGGLVRLLPGTFEIREPLVLRCQDAAVVGSGSSTHIVNKNTDGEPALVLEHPQGAEKKGNNLWRIRLADFRITGNPQSGHGIDARRINEVLVDGVTVSHHGGDGVRLYYCYEDPRVCDSLITYNKQTGLNLIGCHDIVVSSNQFEENQDALRCTDGFNLTMTGNALDDHLGRGVVIENTYGSVVAGNMIEECRDAAIVLDRDCYGNTLSANVIAHNGEGILLLDAHGCAVSANTFTIMKDRALYIGPASGRITVAGNNFSDSFVGEDKLKRGKDDQLAAGILLEGATDVNISGNVFSGVHPKAIARTSEPNSRRVLIDGNVFTETNVDAVGETSMMSNNLTEPGKD